MKVSLLKLRNESKDYFDAHDQVKSFFWGDFLRHYADNQIKHAVIVASPMRASNISRKSVQVQLLVTYASRVFSDFSNLDEVHSDALDVLSDFVDAINYAPRWTDFVSGATAGNAEMFTQRTGDLVAGAAMFITLTIKNTVDLCAQPVTNYDFDLSPQPLPSDCLPATIVNSDGEFSISVPSGLTYELPDTPVLVTDSEGNPLGGEDVPSVTGGTIAVELSPCADASFEVEYANGDPIESGTIPSGGTTTIIVPDCPIPEPCEDANYTLTIDNTIVDSGTIPSGGSASIPIDTFIPQDLFVVIPYFENDTSVEVVIRGLVDGTVASVSTTLTNVTYEVNGLPVVFPFDLENGDVLVISFDSAPTDSEITLNGTYA